MPNIHCSPVLRRTVPFLLAVMMSAPFTAHSQAPPDLVTDRPDQTESTNITGRGLVQLETGAVYTDAGKTGMIDVPGTLLRYGFRERVELRFGLSGWSIDPDSDTSGFGDAEVGYKLRLWSEEGWIPEAAILQHVTIPVGETGYTSDRFDPSVRLAFAHTISDAWSLGYNFAVNWESSNTEHGNLTTLAWMPYSVALGRGVTDRLGVFFEFFGRTPLNAEGGTENLFDAGGTWLLTDTFQLDLAVGAGASDAAADWFVGAGFSWRFPR